jgi:hypothetical protein
MAQESTQRIATFKELCLDVYDGPDGPGRDLGRFWAAATGCEFKVFSDDPRDPGDVVGTEEGMGIAICPVPERRTVKHRVHLDVNTDSVETLEKLGATVLREATEEMHWTVMADPEGGEFCAFVRAPEKLTPYRVYEIGVDAVDALAIGAWWAEVFGTTVQGKQGEPWCWLEDVPGMPFEAMVFAPVPEPKTVKNRWHWDLYGDVEDFLARGATKLWDMPRWTVLADPEGNEFCVFPRP